MNLTELLPVPTQRVRFTLRFQKFVPNYDGCYVLTNYQEEILYVGLSDDLHRRFREHWESKEKCDSTSAGAAFWFFFYPCDSSALARVERGWMNQHLALHGTLPVLNKVFSPVS